MDGVFSLLCAAGAASGGGGASCADEIAAQLSIKSAWTTIGDFNAQRSACGDSIRHVSPEDSNIALAANSVHRGWFSRDSGRKSAVASFARRDAS